MSGHVNTDAHAPLWHWIREREAARANKDAGKPFPWTRDKILQEYRFCNVRREDDRVTRWVHENIRVPYADHEHLWFMLCAARQINWPETLFKLIDHSQYPGAWPTHPTFRPHLLPERMGAALQDMAGKGQKVFTGAYNITAPPEKGRKKTEYVATVTLGNLWRDRELLGHAFGACTRLESAHGRLMRYQNWGPFMAYQAVVDMRFTSLLSKAHDINTWAAAGPGTLRGLNRLHGRPLDQQINQRRACEEMQYIYALAKDRTGVDMDFSDVPNCLCETDKYLRVKNNEGHPRATYVQGRGS